MFSHTNSIFGTSYLDKKVQKNPKYKDIKSVIDTGIHVRKHIDALKELHKCNQFKHGEVFRRIKLSNFIKLVILVAREEIDDDVLVDYGGTKAPIDDTKSSNEEKQSNKKEASVPLTPYQGVLMGIGEWDRKNEEKKIQNPTPPPPPSSPPKPYLLLDVRDGDEYKLSHIITAKNYPFSLLSRTIGYETKDLLNYKNVSKRLIIVYDEDELIASKVATTLVQRGYDNIYLLTGGLKLAQEKCPRGLINGFYLPPLEQKKLCNSTENQQPFKDNFTEEDIKILQLTLDSHYSLPYTNGSSKAPTSYAGRSKSSHEKASDERRKNLDKLNTAKKLQTVQKKQKPWK